MFISTTIISAILYIENVQPKHILWKVQVTLCLIFICTLDQIMNHI